MAGYSGTPLVRKLGIKGGTAAYFHNAPPDFTRTLGPIPEDVDIVPAARQDLDFILLFAGGADDLRAAFTTLSAAIRPDGMLWVAWPKKASGVATDLTENVVRDIGLAGGLVDVKVCAIDDIWSGLKFMVRKVDRARRR